MGQEAECALRRQTFARYQVNARLLAIAAQECILLHPLPAHRGEEVTNDVLDGLHSRVFVQAENRLHVQKAILEWLMECAMGGQKAS
jgi:ornithine carbamoyltransferase